MNQEIEKGIKLLKELDLVSYPEEIIAHLINSVTVGLPIMTVTIPKGKRLVRSRPNEDISRFNEIKDLSFLPHAKNKKYKRASTPNNTMFYASTSAPKQKSTIHETEITFYETVPFLNNIDSLGYAKITYGCWFPKEDLTLLAIIPYTKKYEKKNFIGEMKKHYNANLKETPDEYLTKASIDFLELISSEFSKNVEVEKHYDYMISAIFTEILMKNNSFDGVFYPSIKSDNTCYNVALTPDIIDKLSLIVVGECSIFKNKERIEFCEDAKALVSENGNFNWIENNSSHLNILKKIGIKNFEELTKKTVANS